MNENESIQHIHSIADQVEKVIHAKTEAEVVTHVDPVTLDGAIISKIRAILDETGKSFSGESHVQDLRIVGSHPVEAIIFELPVLPGSKVFESYSEGYRSALASEFPGSSIIIERKQQVTAI